MLIVPIGLVVDIFGLSAQLFSRSLFYTQPDITFFVPGFVDISAFSQGWLSPLYLTLQLFAPGVALLFSFFVALKDRESSPTSSRLAWILFVLLTLNAIVHGGAELLPASLHATESYEMMHTTMLVFTNFLFSMGIAFSGIRLGNERLSVKSFPRMIADWPMNRKFSFAIYAVVLPIVMLASIVGRNFIENSVTNLVGQNYALLARSEANKIGNQISLQVNSLRELSKSITTTNLALRRLSYYDILDNDPVRIENQIAETETRWQEGTENNYTGFINIDDTGFLEEFLSSYPHHTEIMLTDTYGSIIMAVPRPQHYNQADTEWWQTVKDRGGESVYISPIEYDNFAGQYSVDIALPIVDEAGEFVGVLYSKYSLASVISALNNTQIGERGEAELFSETGNWITAKELEQNTIPINQLFIGVSNKNWVASSFRNVDSILAWSTIPEIEANAPLNWLVVVHVPRAEALRLVTILRWVVLVGSAIILGFSLFTTIALSRFITPPLLELTRAAEQFIAGQTDVQVPIHGKDEIGILAGTFNRLTTQLNELITQLETTVKDRTEDLERRALQMETAALVARDTAAIRDVDQLLEQVTDLISERFGFYHIGIFLLDEAREYAVLQAANSEGGQRMLARGHKLQVGRVGVVGYTAGLGEPRIAQDVGADVIYYDNPDMPDTRSEMALPLKVRDQVIGVLDVQSKLANAFTRSDLEIMQILADQLALAIENARLLQRSQSALNELQYLYGERVGQAWRARIENQPISVSYSPAGMHTRIGTQQAQSEALADSSRVISREVKFRDQVIGTIELVRNDAVESWLDEEISLVDEVVEQAALALENARLVEQTRLRSDQLQLLQEVTAVAASHLDPIQLLDAVAQQLVEGFNLLRCGMITFDDDLEVGTLIADAAATTVKDEQSFIGTKLVLADNEVTLEVIRTQKPVVLYDVQENPRTAAIHEELSARGVHSLIITPLIARNRIMGTIGLDIGDPDRKVDEDDLALIEQISVQVATALDVAFLFHAEQQGRQATTSLLEISQIASSSLELEQVLLEVTQRSAQATQANRCSIYLFDENQEYLRPLISLFADGRQDTFQGQRLRVTTSEALSAPYFAQLLQERRPQVLSLDDSPSLTEKWMKPLEIGKLLALPLISQNKVVGLMTLDHPDVDFTFTPAQIELAQTISGIIATSMENVNLFEQAVRRAEREHKVAEITAKVRASNDPQTILQTAVHELRLALGAKKAQVLLPTDQANQVTGEENGHDQNNADNGKKA
ncbi:MAG: GAF domain-containing protein [Anaerolineales bacterium]|nr:GAF domain-containing protein [Anaerolineales bacterium]